MTQQLVVVCVQLCHTWHSSLNTRIVWRQKLLTWCWCGSEDQFLLHKSKKSRVKLWMSFVFTEKLTAAEWRELIPHVTTEGCERLTCVRSRPVSRLLETRHVCVDSTKTIYTFVHKHPDERNKIKDRKPPRLCKRQTFKGTVRIPLEHPVHWSVGCHSDVGPAHQIRNVELCVSRWECFCQAGGPQGRGWKVRRMWTGLSLVCPTGVCPPRQAAPPSGGCQWGRSSCRWTRRSAPFSSPASPAAPPSPPAWGCHGNRSPLSAAPPSGVAVDELEVAENSATNSMTNKIDVDNKIIINHHRFK